MAGRNPHVSGNNSTVTHNIATVITSRSSHPSKGAYGMETSKTLHPPTMKKSNRKYQDRRPRIFVLGDSHACGIACELLHQSTHRLNTIGYVKPNAGLTLLLNTVKDESSKLTKTDTIIVIGGSNDIDKSVRSKNLTSILKFLEDTQNTNVILVEVPVRYDTGVRPHINEQIESYNTKLHKVTKSFKHVRLIKVTTNREHFTKHRLHLNYKGKEIMSKELLKTLLTKHESQKVASIPVPWKKESTNVDAQIIKNVKSNESLNTDMGVEDESEISEISNTNCIETKIDTDAELKEALNSNAQQEDNQESRRNPTKNNKEIGRNLKLQRNCPKVKNNDFLWN